MTDDDTLTTDRPTNVIAALAAVQAVIGGIEKRRKDPADTSGEAGGLKYAYRGIDQIAAAAQPLLGRYGVVIVPTETTIMSTQEFTLNNKPWTDTFITVDWTIYGPGGVTDCITSRTHGIGRDNSDKGINKGATQAYKNLILRILCIGDPQDDADAPQHQGNINEAPVAPPIDDPNRLDAARVFEAVRALPGDGVALFREWLTSRPLGAPMPDNRSISVPELTVNPVWRTEVDLKVRQIADDIAARTAANESPADDTPSIDYSTPIDPDDEHSEVPR